MKTYHLHRASNLKVYHHFSGLSGSQFLATAKNRDLFIGECGSTLYVGLAHTALPSNTNFRLTFLLTRLQEALYEDLPV